MLVLTQRHGDAEKSVEHSVAITMNPRSRIVRGATQPMADKHIDQKLATSIGVACSSARAAA